MTVVELIRALRSGEERRILAAAEAAADALEMLEERVAIMAEDLTAEEWTEQERTAAARIDARRV